MTRTQCLVMVTVLLAAGVTGCAAPSDPPLDEPSAVASPPTSSVDEQDASSNVLTSLDELGGTEWTGLDETYNDRVTFLFGTDGSLSYRTAEGTFTDPADTWSVDGDTLVFQATFGGRYGVASHTATYDAATGELTVEYTTTTNRQSTYTLRQVD